MDRFVKPDYNPTEQDVLRARVRSTGIDEAEFDFGDLAFRFVKKKKKSLFVLLCLTLGLLFV